MPRPPHSRHAPSGPWPSSPSRTPQRCWEEQGWAWGALCVHKNPLHDLQPGRAWLKAHTLPGGFGSDGEEQKGGRRASDAPWPRSLSRAAFVHRLLALPEPEFSHSQQKVLEIIPRPKPRPVSRRGARTRRPRQKPKREALTLQAHLA